MRRVREIGPSARLVRQQSLSSPAKPGKPGQIDRPEAVEDVADMRGRFAVNIQLLDLHQCQKPLGMWREGLLNVRQKARGPIALDDVDFGFRRIDHIFVRQRFRLFGSLCNNRCYKLFKCGEVFRFDGAVIN